MKDEIRIVHRYRATRHEDGIPQMQSVGLIEILGVEEELKPLPDNHGAFLRAGQALQEAARKIGADLLKWAKSLTPEQREAIQKATQKRK